MSESKSHKRLKKKAAGKGGTTEKSITKRRRLDAQTKDKRIATEIERSGDKDSLEEAVKRLKDSQSPQKVLLVPQGDMLKAVEAAKDVGVKLKVMNLSKTKSRNVGL